MKIRRIDRFGNRATGGGSLVVTGHGPGRLDVTVIDCGDGTSDIKYVLDLIVDSSQQCHVAVPSCSAMHAASSSAEFGSGHHSLTP